MQTVRQKLESYCTSNGLSQELSARAVENMVTELKESTPDYDITLDSPAEDYQKEFYGALYEVLSMEALKIIDAEIPGAWYREMFV